MAMKEIKLSRGLVALVDDDVFEFLNTMKWYLMSSKWNNYAHRKWALDSGEVGGVFMHHLITGRRVGLVVDHINGNGLDNRRENLRLVTQSRNIINQRRVGPSGFPGVHKNSNSWAVTMTLNRKVSYLGSFRTKEEAAEAYRKAYLAAHGEEHPFYRYSTT